MSTILVTGGAGYIGSHTAVTLLSQGYDIVIVDNLSNSSIVAVERIREISGKDFPFYEYDVRDKALMRQIFASHSLEAVIHFAGLKAVGESVEIPVAYYRNNIDSTLTLLELMMEFEVKRFVFSSSATVYKESEVQPLREGFPLGCSNPYGWTKLMNEEILRSAAEADRDLSVVLLRYFNPLGAHPSGRIGEDPKGIPNNLMPYILQVAVGKREELRVFGSDYDTVDGTGVRDYIHVMDLAEGHVRALSYLREHKGVIAVNLGTGRPLSVLDVVRNFEAATGVRIPYSLVERRDGDIGLYYADPSLAAEILGWRAARDIRDMCVDGWRWQKNNPNGYGI